MALKLSINAGLLAIPIIGTLGALVGIDAHRSATGQSPLFQESSGSSWDKGAGVSAGGGFGGTGSPSNEVANTVCCDRFYGILPLSKGEQFILNPNQWGVKDTSSGALCMNVTILNNGTYPSRTTAPEFSVTWQFDPGPDDAPVHAFPNILVDKILPIPVCSINQIVFDLHWTYGVGNTPAEFTSSSDLTANSVNTNVAVDMFFDSDPRAAQNSTQAMYEVMVWFAQIGGSSKPYGDKTSTSRKLDGTTFNLWSGKKSDTITGEKYVLTWVASEITGRFTGDIYPLITDLYNLSGDIYPSSTDYLGILSFGTETYSAARNVTFWASTLSIDIQK